MRVQPTITGKAAIASQLILIAYILLSINFDGVPSPGNWMFLTVAALTIVSGLHYIYRGLKNT
jgi:cardiolipin synthase